ncbi:MAG: hypothetical protein CME14_02020 [Gemmatimonadetes bacterium]|jgi:hypothetical protein|nr:hypothetical protein [Gemmatimonadota bacterium]
MLVDTRRRSIIRLIWTLVLGLFLGGLCTKLSELFLPDSAARDFLTTSVEASLGPLSVDLIAIAFTLGPISISLNVLTLVGVSVVAMIARSLI